MTEPTSITSDESIQNKAIVDPRKKSTDSNDSSKDLPPKIVPFASDVSGHLALLMASSAVAVAIFLIILVAKAASNA